MRIKFVLGIVRERDEYPADSALCQWLRAFGWEPKEAVDKDSDDEKAAVYKDLAEGMFAEMPEVAQDEKDDLIFASRFASEQTRFLVTRSTEGELTFRFLHEDLPNLFAGTERLIRAIHDQVYGKNPRTVRERLWLFWGRPTMRPLYAAVDFIPSNNALLYERASNHVIMRGRIIRNFFKEAFFSNLKDALISAAGALAIAIYIFAKLSIQHASGSIPAFFPLVIDILAPLMGAITVAFAIGLVGFFLTYRKIVQSTIVAWEPVSGH